MLLSTLVFHLVLRKKMLLPTPGPLHILLLFFSFLFITLGILGTCCSFLPLSGDPLTHLSGFSLNNTPWSPFLIFYTRSCALSHALLSVFPVWPLSWFYICDHLSSISFLENSLSALRREAVIVRTTSQPWWQSQHGLMADTQYIQSKKWLWLILPQFCFKHFA